MAWLLLFGIPKLGIPTTYHSGNDFRTTLRMWWPMLMIRSCQTARASTPSLISSMNMCRKWWNSTVQPTARRDNKVPLTPRRNHAFVVDLEVNNVLSSFERLDDTVPAKQWGVGDRLYSSWGLPTNSSFSCCCQFNDRAEMLLESLVGRIGNGTMQINHMVQPKFFTMDFPERGLAYSVFFFSYELKVKKNQEKAIHKTCFASTDLWYEPATSLCCSLKLKVWAVLAYKEFQRKRITRTPQKHSLADLKQVFQTSLCQKDGKQHGFGCSRCHQHIDRGVGGRFFWQRQMADEQQPSDDLSCRCWCLVVKMHMVVG